MVTLASAQTLDFSFDRTKPVEILSNQLVVSDNQKQGIFSGQVQVTQDKYKLRADRIIVDYTDAKGSSDVVKRMTAYGNVYLFTDNQQAAKADKMVYNLISKILTLSKNVLITYDNNTLKGDKIIVNTQTRHIQVTGSKTQRVKAYLILPPDDE